MMPTTMTLRMARLKLMQADSADKIGANESRANAAKIAACFVHKKFTVYYTIEIFEQCKQYKQNLHSSSPCK
jgi:hypothetical protein